MIAYTSLATPTYMLNHSISQQTEIYMDKMDDDVVEAYAHAV